MRFSYLLFNSFLATANFFVNTEELKILHLLFDSLLIILLSYYLDIALFYLLLASILLESLLLNTDLQLSVQQSIHHEL